jgi:hypothetical protein|eukprot:SAG25_NODE_231_length_11417_cov_12.831684_4_plen_177_part_00
MGRESDADRRSETPIAEISQAGSREGGSEAHHGEPAIAPTSRMGRGGQIDPCGEAGIPASRPAACPPRGGRMPGTAVVPPRAPPTPRLSSGQRDISGKPQLAPVRIPGYTGYVPGAHNHIYGQPQVASPRSLRSLQSALTERREQLTHTENRAIVAATERGDITTSEGRGHIPGCA